MSKQLDFHDNYYLRGENIIHVGTGYLQIPIGNDIVITEPAGKMRLNKYRNVVNIGLNSSWLVLADIPDTATFVNRTGDSMTGDLRMMGTSKILNSSGSINEPSYTFLNDEDTGIINPAPNTISFIVGGDLNKTEVIKVERTGNSNTDSNIFLEGDVWVDELTFTRRGGLKLDGDYAYFTGTTGLRLPQGTTAQRPASEIGIIRYNSTLDVFDIGFNVARASTTTTATKWGNLSLEKNKSTWFVRSGDSVFGDIQLTNNARILATNGTASLPSITFDSDARTGFYKSANGISLSIESNRNVEPVIKVTRIADSIRGNQVLMNADLLVEEISFSSLRMHGDYAYVDGVGGFRLPIGNTAQRNATTGVLRYNNQTNTFEMRTNNKWIIASGNIDTDTWVNRTGDSMTGNLKMTSNSLIRTSYGTVAAPSYSFDGDEDTGLIRSGSDAISLVVGGTVNATPAIIINRTGTGNNDKTITINGNLIVNGTQTTINTTELVIDDNKITLNKGNTGAVASGIEVENNGAVASTLQYVFSSNSWTFDNSKLSMVNNPTSDKDAANKIYVDTEIATLKAYTDNRIDTEIARATGEEERIEQKLDTNVTRIDGRIDTTNTNLASEITRATGEEERIEDKLDTNVTRIDGRIDTTNTNLASEITRATGEEERIETELRSEIAAEVTRATAAEATLTTEVNKKLNKSGGTMSGEINMGGNRITNVGTPVAASDAVTVGFLQTIIFDGGTF